MAVVTAATATIVVRSVVEAAVSSSILSPLPFSLQLLSVVVIEGATESSRNAASSSGTYLQ